MENESFMLRFPASSSVGCKQRGDTRDEILDIYSEKRTLDLINSISVKDLALTGLCRFVGLIVRPLESHS